MKNLLFLLFTVIASISFAFSGCELNGPDTSGYSCINGNCISVTSDADFETVTECVNYCGGGNCNYTQFTGADNCDSGYDPVTPTACCPVDYPYYCSQTNSCYSSCDAAETACSVTVVKADATGGGGSSGQIFFRLQYDLTYPPANGASSCDITPGNYTDNNNAVPDNAAFNTYYGSCQPGTYSAQYVWDIYASPFTYVPFTYTLVSPAPGYNRYYTQFMIDYFEGTNRCHNVTATPSYLTYIDELQ
jgi:hypothetical protein